MLKLFMPTKELWNDELAEFIELNAVELELEHSLLSLSKWESEYQKPFLSDILKTPDEILGYVYHMIITPGVSRNVIFQIDQENLDKINEYIESKQSATTFGEMPKRTGRAEIITSELIYYWMVAFNIPFECETWHLNRLFSLIRICNIKQSTPTKQSKAEIAKRNRELNEQRKAQYGTKG